MAYRTLEVTLISAKDLSKVNLLTKMEVYAVAMIAGDPKSKKKTAPDRAGGKNPTWNATVKFTVPEQSGSSLVLNIVLKSERALGDRDIGEVNVPIRELLEGWHRAAAASGGNGMKKAAALSPQFVSYQVGNCKTSTVRAKGVLSISYKFTDVVTVPTPPAPSAYPMGPTTSAYGAPPPQPAYGAPSPQPAYPPHVDTGMSAKVPEPVTAYPAPAGTSTAAYPPYPYPPPPQAGYAYPPQPQQHGGGYAYPPQQQGGGYGYPPQQQGGYGYPPPPAGYGYGAAGPQVVQPAGKKMNKMGLGLGAGLLGGAIGGMLLGDMISDDNAAYDAGYDNGFGDGYDDGGFDDGGFGF